MSLRNDFHVANAHVLAYRFLGNFIQNARDLAATPAIKSALDHAPKAVTRNRNFVQIVLDDAMEAFATIMARALEETDADLSDLPHEFYGKLLEDRRGRKVTDQEAKDALEKQINAIISQPYIPQRSHTPTFLKLIMANMEPPKLAATANMWSGVIRSFSTLIMSNPGLAAMSAADDIIHDSIGDVQQQIDDVQGRRQSHNNNKNGANDNEPGDGNFKIHKVEDLADIETEMSRLVGMDDPKELIREIEARVRHLRILKDAGMTSGKDGGGIEHFVFTGNPGTGKTTFARLIGKIYKENGLLKKGHVVEADRGDIVAGFVGQTALQTKKAVNAALDGVLFIDEAYALQGEGNDFGKEARDTLLKAMEMNKDRLVVVIAGYPEPMEKFIKSNPGLPRRFKYHMNFPDFSIGELMEIFDMNIERHNKKITAEARDAAEAMLVANKKMMGKHFGNAGIVENLVELLNNKLSLALENDGTLDQYDALTKQKKPIPQDMKTKLVTITPDIVAQIRLEGKRAVATPSGNHINTAGLGDRKIANAPPPAAPAVGL